MITDAVLHDALLTAALPAPVVLDTGTWRLWVSGETLGGLLVSINSDKTGAVYEPGEDIPNQPERVFVADVTFTPTEPGEFTEDDFLGLSYVPLEFYTAQYSASSGGSITGDTNQVVPESVLTKPVTAVAYPGHSFVIWSDGVTTAERQDSTWTDVVALFTETVSDIYILQQYKE